MRRTPRQYAEALYLATRDKGDGDAARIVSSFVSTLAAQGLSALLPSVLGELPQAAKRADGTEDVTVESAHEIDEAQGRKAVAAAGLDPDAVAVTRSVMPEVLGGLRVRTKDTVYDATLKNGLDRLKDAAGRLRN